MGRDLFEGIEQTQVETSAGPCAMPIMYTDAAVIGLMYRCDVKLAAECLGVDSPFEIFPMMGKAVVQLAFFEYTASTIGRYNEAALCVNVRRKGTRPSALRALLDPRGNEDQGLYFYNLPVDSADAKAAGCELWNFPKYVTGIECDFRETGIRCELENEIEVSIGPPGAFVTPGIPLIIMSKKDGRILRTIVETGHRLRWGGAPSTELRVLGDGPMANNVARLGLDAVKPSAAWRTLEMRSILPLGKDLGPAD